MGPAPHVSALVLLPPVDPVWTAGFGLMCICLAGAARLLDRRRRRNGRCSAKPRSSSPDTLDRTYLAQRARDFAHAQGTPEMTDVLTQFLVHNAERAERLRRRWASTSLVQPTRRWRGRSW